MKKTILLAVAAVFLLASMLNAEVRTNVLRTIAVEGAALDMDSSPDGRMAFVLTRGAVKVYSLPDGRLMETIPVDRKMDRITGTPKGDLLLLGSSTGKSVRVVRLDFVKNIETAGAPVRGAKGAPVTIAVFSDFQ